MPFPVGRVTLWSLPYPDAPRREWRWHATNPNSLVYDWGHVAARCLGLGQREYKIGGMYLEFENVLAPGDTVPVVDVDPALGLEYFQALSGNKDYLRVALSGTPELGIAAGFEDYFAPGQTGNMLTFVARTSATAGVRGLPFSDGDRSVVYGLALVATPVPGDHGADVVFARSYFAGSQQLAKEASRQVAVTWEHRFDQIV